MRTIIIDDERQSRELLKKMLREGQPELEVIAEAGGVGKGAELVNSLHPELIFLDIEMPDGSGFDLLEKIPYIDFHVVFITAHEEHAIKAIKFGALDYLLKPFDQVELASAIKKALETKVVNNYKEQLQLVREILQLRKPPTRIQISTSKKTQYVSVADIIRLGANGNYTDFYLHGHQGQLMTSQILKYYEQRFELYPYFKRVHKSHIVNLHFVDSYLHEGYLIMKDKSEVPVSKRYRDDLLGGLANI